MQSRGSRLQTRLRFLAGVAVLLPAICVCWTVLAQETGADDVRDLSGFSKEYDAVAVFLHSAFSDEQLWTMPRRRAELEEYLRVANKLRSEKLVPVLLDRVAYTRFSEVEEKRTPEIAGRFPVVGVLEAIGVRSVRAIVERLSVLDGDRATEDDGVRLTRNLLTYTLVKIYDRGGDGNDLAQRRIEREVERAPDAKKKRLGRVLEHPLFGK